MRISGIGITYLGIGRKDAADRCYATRWFTILWAPVAPLGRDHLQLLPHRGSGFSYRVIGRTPLVAREVVRTYVFGWLLIPLMLFGPLVFPLSEVQQALGLPASWQTPSIVAGIAWLVIATWKLADWHESRGHPRSIA